MESLKHFLQLKEDLPSIESHVIFNLGIFSFSASTIMIIFFIVLSIILAFWVKRFAVVPGKKQSIIELFILKLFDFLNTIIDDYDVTKRVFPYFASVFFFILLSNFIYLVPGILNFTYHGSHLAITPTTDFNTTFALALTAVLLINVSSIKSNGFLKHLSHFLQFDKIINGFRKGVGQGFVGIIHFFVGIIEIIAEFAKIISLSLRLFGNIFAHEVLSIIIIGALSVVLPAIWMGFGVLVGFVQAIVFTSLITVYFSLYHKNKH